MAYSQAQNKATQRYQAKAYDRCFVRFKKGYVDEVIKPAAEMAGESLNEFAKKAIEMRIAEVNAKRDKTENATET